MAPFEMPETAETANTEAVSPLGWLAAAAALVLMVCICGAAAGIILGSAGFVAYTGISSGGPGAVVTPAVPVAVGPTEPPPPTYTYQPTYTPLSTYTPVPTAVPPTQTPVVIILTPTPQPTAPQPTQSSGLTQDVDHTVEAGETVASIAQQYGVDVVPIIFANGLDQTNPQVSPGDLLTVPADVSEWCVPANQATQADVVSVVDGDTIEVNIGGQDFTVRYIGVEAPEAGANAEAFADEALGANLDLVDGQTVGLIEDVTNADDSGELPRYVLVDNRFINYEMVRQGYAEATSASPDTACDDLFALAAQYAQDESLGMWGSGTGAQDQLQATATLPAANWTPPPTLSATATSSLGFDCHCWGSNAVWGNFQNDAQGDACQAICEIQAARVAAACATAAASAGVAPGVYGCR